MKKISKTEAKENIEQFFEEVKNKSPKEIKKIKTLAMSQKIPLKEKRKLFCKFCLNPFSKKEKVRIKAKIKKVECSNCKKINRWKMIN